MTRHNTFICIAAALALSAFGCKGKDEDKKEAPKTTPATAPKTAPKTAPNTTPKTTAKAADPIAAAVGHANRPQDDKDRDADRKPAEVLTFVGVAPGMKVADLFAFGGYYTELLGRVVGPTGKVWAQDDPGVLEKFPDPGELMKKRLEDAELAKVVEHKVTGFDALGLPAGELDLVFIANAYHDLAWMNEGKIDRGEVNKAIFEALKPGGHYVIIDHHGAEGNEFKVASTLHRGDAEATKAEVTAVGFELAEESDILENEEDKLDAMVFDPSIKGKTSRFIYKFQKPEAE